MNKLRQLIFYHYLPEAKLGEIKQVLVLICFFMRIIPY